MRRTHVIVGLAGVVAFLLSGQMMGHHHPKVAELPGEVRMMYVSRHIYLLGAALVNLTLGLYLRLHPPGWRRTLQQVGSLLILLSAVSLMLAFVAEPALGVAGRSWRSYVGLISFFAGAMTHFVASLGREH
jgi:hypothetical protein